MKASNSVTATNSLTANLCSTVKITMKILGRKANTKNHGLLNQGATCYLNSVLQVLFRTKEFREALERHTTNLDHQLKDLFDELQRQTAQTYKITKKLGISRVYEQQDAAEFFEKILTLTSPDASKIFHGQLTHTTICSRCNTKIKTDSGIWLLPLVLMNSCNEEYSVADGIKEYFRDSHFTGQDQMYCDRCDDKVDVTVKCEVKHHPEVLVLLLKRFEFDYRYMRYVKNTHFVNVPQVVQIPERQTYDLYAVVDHVGDLRGGHYTASIKTQDGNDDGTWYKFSDDKVKPLGCQLLEISNSAYLLFYKKRQKMCDAQSHDAVTIKIINRKTSEKKRHFLGTKFICLLMHLFIITIVINIVVLILWY